MSEAEWTPSPVTEREAALLQRRARWGPLHLIGAAVSCCAAMVSFILFTKAIDSGAGFGTCALALLGFIASAALPAWLAVRDAALVRSVAAPDLAKREEFGAGEGWLVDLTMLQGAAPTGTDRGMLWIEGGRLLFSGDRTSFALAPSQVLPPRGQTPVARLRRATVLPLLRRTAGGGLALSFDVVDDPMGEARREARRKVETWALAGGSGEGQFPPTALGPGSASPARLFVQAGLPTAVWLAVLGLALECLLVGPPVAAAFVLGLAFAANALGYGRPILRWRAFWDRLRLEGRDT